MAKEETSIICPKCKKSSFRKGYEKGTQVALICNVCQYGLVKKKSQLENFKY